MDLVGGLLAAYVILLPVQLPISDTIRFAPSDLFLVGILLTSALNPGWLRLVRSSWSIWHLGMLLTFFAASLIALVRVGRLAQSTLLNKDVGLLVLFASYAVIVSETQNWDQVRRLLRLLLISTATQNLISIAAFMFGRVTGVTVPLLNYQDIRVSGLLVDPNAYGGLLVLALCIHIATSNSPQPLVSRPVGWLITVTLTIGVLLTYSRSAWLALAALLVVGALCRPKSAIQLLIVCVLAIAIVVRLLGPDYVLEMQNLAFRQSQIQARVDMVNMAVPMFWQHPAFGSGLGVFYERYGAIIHNTVLWILTECGIVGLTVFAGFVMWFLRKGILTYRLTVGARKPIVLGLLLACISMLSLSAGIEALYQRHWWMVLALIASSYSLARHQRSTAPRYQRAGMLHNREEMNR